MAVTFYQFLASVKIRFVIAIIIIRCQWENFRISEFSRVNVFMVLSVLEAVEFAGLVKTKRDALLKEIGPLFNIQNFNELVRNTWSASKHMMVVFYFHFFDYFIANY